MASEAGSRTYSGSTSARTVVICGSMKSINLMSRIAAVLESAGLKAVAPAADEPAEEWNRDAINALKREASRRHMNYIKQPDTAAVLVVNVDRPEVRNYIGPNAFAEIGVAFADGRAVFLLQGMPESYEDELRAWDVKCLNGDLRPLLSAVSAPGDIDWQAWQSALQQELIC